MKAKACGACGGKVAVTASACPHCGKPTLGNGPVAHVVAFVVAVPLFLLLSALLFFGYLKAITLPFKILFSGSDDKAAVVAKDAPATQPTTKPVMIKPTTKPLMVTEAEKAQLRLAFERQGEKETAKR